MTVRSEDSSRDFNEVVKRGRSFGAIDLIRIRNDQSRCLMELTAALPGQSAEAPRACGPMQNAIAWVWHSAPAALLLLIQ